MIVNNDFKITEHAYLRMKQRNGWNRKAADRMVGRVLKQGKRPDEVKGYLRQWLDRKMDRSEKDKTFIIYGQKLYVFIDSVMITVISVPSKKTICDVFF